MRISDWSSDVCSSDLQANQHLAPYACRPRIGGVGSDTQATDHSDHGRLADPEPRRHDSTAQASGARRRKWFPARCPEGAGADRPARSEEHTSELQSLMRISYAVFCLKKKTNNNSY